MVQICNKNGLIVGRLEWSELVFQNGPSWTYPNATLNSIKTEAAAAKEGWMTRFKKAHNCPTVNGCITSTMRLCLSS